MVQPAKNYLLRPPRILVGNGFYVVVTNAGEAGFDGKEGKGERHGFARIVHLSKPGVLHLDDLQSADVTGDDADPEPLKAGAPHDFIDRAGDLAAAAEKLDRLASLYAGRPGQFPDGHEAVGQRFDVDASVPEPCEFAVEPLDELPGLPRRNQVKVFPFPKLYRIAEGDQHEPRLDSESFFLFEKI